MIIGCDETWLTRANEPSAGVRLEKEILRSIDGVKLEGMIGEGRRFAALR